MGQCVFVSWSLLTLTTSQLSRSPSLLVDAKRVMLGDLCVSPFTAPLLPMGGACASLTSESLPQRCSDVLRCLLKNLPGDCRHGGRCPIISCVLLPVVMDHSPDAGLQSVMLSTGRVRRQGVKEIWLQGKEQWLRSININISCPWVMWNEHMLAWNIHPNSISFLHQEIQSSKLHPTGMWDVLVIGNVFVVHLHFIHIDQL